MGSIGIRLAINSHIQASWLKVANVFTAPINALIEHRKVATFSFSKPLG
jgi:hypothetical protein